MGEFVYNYTVCLLQKCCLQSFLLTYLCTGTPILLTFLGLKLEKEKPSISVKKKLHPTWNSSERWFFISFLFIKVELVRFLCAFNLACVRIFQVRLNNVIPIFPHSS
jgi:hypothetical protein